MPIYPLPDQIAIGSPIGDCCGCSSIDEFNENNSVAYCDCEPAPENADGISKSNNIDCNNIKMEPCPTKWFHTVFATGSFLYTEESIETVCCSEAVGDCLTRCSGVKFVTLDTVVDATVISSNAEVFNLNSGSNKILVEIGLSVYHCATVTEYNFVDQGSGGACYEDGIYQIWNPICETTVQTINFYYEFNCPSSGNSPAISGGYNGCNNRFFVRRGVWGGVGLSDMPFYQLAGGCTLAECAGDPCNNSPTCEYAEVNWGGAAEGLLNIRLNAANGVTILAESKDFIPNTYCLWPGSGNFLANCDCACIQAEGDGCNDDSGIFFATSGNLTVEVTIGMEQ